MNDYLENTLRHAPSLEPDQEKLQATFRLAVSAYRDRHQSTSVKKWALPMMIATAASLMVMAGLFWAVRKAPEPLESAPILSREMVIQAYADFVGAFPDGLTAIVFIDGELQIFPGCFAAPGIHPSYLEIMIGDRSIKAVAAAGSTIPLELNGGVFLIDLLPDATGHTTVSGQDFYWSRSESYLPHGVRIVAAQKLEVML